MAAISHVYVLPDQSPYRGGKIYDRWGNLEYFADVTSLTDEASSGGTDSFMDVKAHPRKPYINSKTEISVEKHSRNVVTGIAQSKGALPGIAFQLVSANEKRQFTTTASMSATYTWLKANAKIDFTLYWDGRPKDPIVATNAA